MSRVPRLTVVVTVSDVTIVGWVALVALALFVMTAPSAASLFTRTVNQHTVRARFQVGKFHWMVFPLIVYGWDAATNVVFGGMEAETAKLAWLVMLPGMAQ